MTPEEELEYWQMKEVLGYPIPNWVDERWPLKFAGNGGVNPLKCGLCDARKLHPELHQYVATLTGVRSALERFLGRDLTEAETELLRVDLESPRSQP